jgi:endonuclease/exonuclease/phosphatase family metal-dependent hydrolase
MNKLLIINLKRKTVLILSVLMILWGFTACKTGGDGNNDNNPPPTPTINVNTEGNANTLEIATWNLEHFPLNGSTTLDTLKEIISQLDIDIYAVQEIEDTSSFQQLTSNLDNYDGLLSNHVYSSGEYQKTGIIYKKDMVTILSSQLLFTNDTNAFPRPPLLLNIIVRKDGKEFDFYLIIIHLKAFSEPENVARRRAAALALKNYMDTQIADPNQLEKDYIVAGDWNDLITDPPANNAFQIFIDAPGAYRFITDVLANDSIHASYPSYGELIDHILISSDCFTEYQNGSIKTIRLDDQVSSYTSDISDHRPVMAIFPVL